MCMHACVGISRLICMHVCFCVSVLMWLDVHACVSMCVYVFVHKYICVCNCVSVCVCVLLFITLSTVRQWQSEGVIPCRHSASGTFGGTTPRPAPAASARQDVHLHQC